MRRRRSLAARLSRALAPVAVIGAMALAASGQSIAPMTPMLESPKSSGGSVIGAFEGWYSNPDGSFGLLVGYMNRNVQETLDIPVGPNNRIEPGGPDRGQPTHFLQRRQYGMFVVHVPKDFATTTKQLQWTLVANGQPTVIPLSLHPEYEIEPLRDPAGNTPPVLRFAKGGPPLQGPPKPLSSGGVARSLTARVGRPVELSVLVSDDMHREPGDELVKNRAASAQPPAVSATWSKFRGPGAVAFAEGRARVVVDPSGVAKTAATFASAGEYLLRVAGNDASGEGGGGFQCCWSSTFVRVTVTGS